MPGDRSVESHLWTEGEAEENKDFHPLQCPVGSGHGGLLTRAVPKDHKAGAPRVTASSNHTLRRTFRTPFVLSKLFARFSGMHIIARRAVNGSLLNPLDSRLSPRFTQWRPSRARFRKTTKRHRCDQRQRICFRLGKG